MNRHFYNQAKKGIKFIQAPYCVKGMDLSMTGLLSYFEDIVNNREHLKTDATQEIEVVDEKIGKALATI